MTPHEEFWAWMSGFAAALAGLTPSEEDWNTIKRKLNSVLDADMENYKKKFEAVTPSHMKSVYLEPYSTAADYTYGQAF